MCEGAHLHLSFNGLALILHMYIYTEVLGNGYVMTAIAYS